MKHLKAFLNIRKKEANVLIIKNLNLKSQSRNYFRIKDSFIFNHASMWPVIAYDMGTKSEPSLKLKTKNKIKL